MNISAIIFILIMVLLPKNVMAAQAHNPIVDIYGTQQINAEEIYNNYAKEFKDITNIMFSKNYGDSQSSIRIKSILEKIKAGIEQKGDFSYVEISPILYSDRKDIYFTVDVVDSSESRRLDGFISKPQHSFKDPDGLLAAWESYENTVMTKFMREKTQDVNFICPAFHCLEGSVLKKYQKTFSTLVPKNKDKLITILREEKDEEKRAAAAYLLGYINDGNELIKILVPAMRDSSPAVRNNSMRVLAYALINRLSKADFPVQKAIDALNYPTALDRNKSVSILFGLASQPRYASYIKDHAKSQLMTLLKMKQCNVHDTAYYILEIISGLKFGDRDYTAWENWLNTTKKS